MVSRLTRISRSFVWRLSFVFFWASFLLYLLFAYFFQTLWIDYKNLTIQMLNWGVAEELLREFAPLLDPEVNAEQVEQKMFDFAFKVPQYEIYIIDAEGNPLLPRPTPEITNLHPLPPETLERFVTTETFPGKAMYIRNPGFDPTDEYIFSAARVTVAGKPGYLLVILESKDLVSTQNMVGDLTVYSATLLFSVVGLLLTSALAVGVFYLLTRRFSRMTAILREFRSGNFERRLTATGRDELGEHAVTINEMADRIVESMATIEAKDVSRRELIASVAHDLRTPIAVLQISLETLIQEAQTLSPDELGAKIRGTLRSCESLDLLISELFELSKLGAEDFRPAMAPVSVEDFLLGLAEQFEGTAQASDMAFEVSPTDPTWSVLADPHLLERAVANLLRNAIKFTPAGGTVTLSATQVGSSIRFSIRDTGIGIPSGALPHIFDRFYQADNQGKLQHQGTGLGLAIVKRIVELHQSAIQVTSEERKGTEFAFELPMLEGQ